MSDQPFYGLSRVTHLSRYSAESSGRPWLRVSRPAQRLAALTSEALGQNNPSPATCRPTSLRVRSPMKTRGWLRRLSFALATLFAVFAEPWVPLSQIALSAGQRPPTRPSFDSVDQWLSVIERHVPGQRDEALRTATSWHANELYEILFHAGPLVALASDPDAVINFRRLPGSDKPMAVYSEGDLKRLQELSRRASRLGNRAFLTRGVLLHTDAALLVEGALGGDAHRPNIRSEQVFVQESDGRQLGSHEIAGHLKAARTLLGLLSTKSQADDTVRLWYRATVAYLQREVQLDQVHVDAALALFPKDPEILLLAGALHETFASARMQQLVASADLPFGASLGIKSTHDELRLAERLFRRAVSADGQHAEARLHLGNVLAQLDRHKEAAGVLRQALRLLEPTPCWRTTPGCSLGGKRSNWVTWRRPGPRTSRRRSCFRVRNLP
jgi:tetratricopeptide (TPR) repeat protein